jgi:hypothetical protein
MVVLLRQRRTGWQLGPALLAILLFSEGLHYLFPIGDTNVPGFVRLAELIVWPVAAVGLWRRPHSARTVEKVTVPAVPNASPATQTMSAELLRTELASANRRNQQLRETNRQTRQQLAAETAARQAAETRLANVLNSEQTITEQLQAEAPLRAELRDSQAALAEARRTSDRAQAQIAEQASQLGALRQQVATLERLVRERNGQVERRHPVTNEDRPGPNTAIRPKNGNTSREESPGAAAGGNGLGAASRAAHLDRAGTLGSDLEPELTPTIAGPVCPLLGLQADHATRHAFPSDANRCLGLEAPAEVSLEQ